MGKFTGGGHRDSGKSADGADRKKNRKKPEPAVDERRRSDRYRDDYDYDDGRSYERDDYDDDVDGNTYRSYDDGVRPTAADASTADRRRRLFGSTQTLDRHRAGRTASGNRTHDAEVEPTMNGVRTGNGVHRYYLGEDPFGGSIYGREKEYDGVTYNKRRSHKKTYDHPQQQHHHTHYVQR